MLSGLISIDKIKTIKITKKTKEQWEKWVQGKDSKPNFNDIVYLGEDEIRTRTQVTEEKENQATSNEMAQNDGTVSGTKIEETLKKAGVEFTADLKYISYVTLGDLIECAFQTVLSNLDGTAEYSKRLKLEPTDSERRALLDLSRQNIICGNISNDVNVIDINKPKEEITFISKGSNLLDIPIDIKLIKLFLIENVIKPQKDTYSLFSFIKDIVTKLVVGVLNGSNLYNSQTNVYSDVTLATTIFSLGDANENANPMIKLNGLINPENALKFQNTISNHYINNVNTHSNYYNYFVIYDKKFVDFFPTNKRVEDQKLGIYHYTVGEDIGLLKSANFSRIDTPYLKEAKAVGKQTFYLGQFRDRYNVDLTMVGNNIYYPGMMLYIQPSAEAVQTVSETDPSFSQITGIGGYYFVEKVDSTISEEGYETKLSCIWQYAGDEKPEETVDGLTACNVAFSNPKAENIFNLIVTKLQNEVEAKASAAARLASVGTAVSIERSTTRAAEFTGGDEAARRGARRGEI